MAELALTVQEKYRISTDVLNCLLLSIVNEYQEGAKGDGPVIYEQSERGLQTQDYQQSVTSNEFSMMTYVTIGLELVQQGILSTEGFQELVDAHYADRTLYVGEVPELVAMLQEELDVESDEEIDEEVLLTSFFSEYDGQLYNLGLVSEDFVTFWNDFIWWAQRHVLRLSFTALDCVGEGFYYGHTTYFTSFKIHEFFETHAPEIYVDEPNPLGRKFPRQLQYESHDWDFVSHRANAFRGGGFSCFM